MVPKHCYKIMEVYFMCKITDGMPSDTQEEGNSDCGSFSEAILTLTLNYNTGTSSSFTFMRKGFLHI